MTRKHQILNKQCCIAIIILTCLLTTCSTVPSFGMNKPHHLFHLGHRRSISLNLGWGYWVGDGPNRLTYQNTDNGLYASMNIHDGSSMFEQIIEDRSQKVNSQIKYTTNQKKQQGGQTDLYWTTQIEMENSDSQPMTWYTYALVENNDYRLVDHKGYSSYMHIKPQKIDFNTVKLNCDSKLLKSEAISIYQKNTFEITDEDRQKGIFSQKLNIFGLTANISETFAIKDISSEFKHLIQISRGENVERNSDNSTVAWQDRQLQMIKSDEWENNVYVVMFVYGVIPPGQKSKIFMTNSTSEKQFDYEYFEGKKNKIAERYKLEDKQLSQFVQHVVSNLYGGITYYYGRLYTQNSLTIHSQDSSYTFTPSRLIFPRSFLWDDGFHQSVVVHYDHEMVLDMLRNWMNKVDVFGWIGRQQIRGGDITSMMPDSRFVFQDWFQMNPPTLLLPILTLIQKAQNGNYSPSQKTNVVKFLLNSYRKLEQWYRYFKNTQSHQSLEYPEFFREGQRFYRWQCKDECSRGNFMGSGLDDYPRMNRPEQISKQHVDLLSWLYFFSDSLDKIGKFIEKEQGGAFLNYARRRKYYQQESQQYISQIYEHMFDKSDGLFKDVAVSRSDLFIEEFVDVVGYINLFPFFTGLLKEGVYENDDKRVKGLKSCLKIMSDTSILLSEDGLRSLSMQDKNYGTEENYWRGAVWLPINYMVLRACKLYYWSDSSAEKEVRQLYTTLRENLITSLHKNYKQTGYLYENYYEGKGHRGFPFYGWTSLIANIITQKY